MRAGAEYFLEPGEAPQRPYEALRCYLVEGARAEEVGDRFGYSPATVHQLAAELRAGRSSFFRSSMPGPKGPRKTVRLRDQVLVLRAEDRSVTEIAASLTAQGSPVSAQTVWKFRCKSTSTFENHLCTSESIASLLSRGTRRALYPNVRKALARSVRSSADSRRSTNRGRSK